MKGIGSYIKRTVSENPAAFKTPDTFKMSRKDTCRRFGCLFFGKKTNQKSNQRAVLTSTSDSSELKKELLPKLQAQYELINSALDLENYLTLDSIDIINNGNRITASTQCAFCKHQQKQMKTITIQYDTAKNDLAYWNFSNLKKHLKRHPCDDKEQSNDEETKSREEDISSGIELHPGMENMEQEDILVDIVGVDDDDAEISDEILLTSNKSNFSNSSDGEKDNDEIQKNGDDFNIDPLEIAIYGQISQQNLSMTNAIYTHGERKHTMNFLINGDSTKLSVIKIKGDGSCMFGSIAHQLFNHKVNSRQHKQATKKLNSLNNIFKIF